MSGVTAIEPQVAGVESVDLDDLVAEIAGILNAQHGRLVEVVAAAIEGGAWQQSGIHSPAQWLALKAGLSPHRASEIVRCAERRSDLPEVHGAASRGELAIDQVIAASKAPAWADADVAEFAKNLTVAQLRTTMTKRFFDDGTDESDDEPPAAPTDRVSTRVEDDGRWRISGVGDVARGSIVDAALAEAKDSLFERGQTDATWFDALVEISERSLDAIESPARRERFRTWVHVDATTGAATTTQGAAIPRAIRDQLLCDGVVQPVWERHGSPVSVGRSQRIVPDRTRRVIERRDQGCRVPGCTSSRFVEIHHIVHWSQGGPTDTANLISLCGKHHRLHHLGRLGIDGDADRPGGVTFTDDRGRVLDPCSRPRPPTRPPPRPESTYEPATGGRLDFGYFTGWVSPDVLAARREANQSRAALA